MKLYNIDYIIVSTGMNFKVDIVGLSETDCIQELVSVVGQVRILSIFHKSIVHRITGTIRKNIIEQSQMKQPTRGKGRPRKLDI